MKTLSNASSLAPGQILSPARRKSKRRGSKIKSKTHKYSRILHAYLSAFAFLILMFFAGSGLLLNHPEWFASKSMEEDSSEEAFLDVNELNRAADSGDEGLSLARLIQNELPLVGAFQSAELFPGEEAFLRYSGAKGNSDVVVDFVTGAVEYEVVKAGLVEIIHNLHRGKDSGAVWSGVIDVSAILVLALSMFGFLLMFFIKFRLAKSMFLFGSSAVALGAIYALFVT